MYGYEPTTAICNLPKLSGLVKPSSFFTACAGDLGQGAQNRPWSAHSRRAGTTRMTRTFLTYHSLTIDPYPPNNPRRPSAQRRNSVESLFDAVFIHKLFSDCH